MIQISFWEIKSPCCNVSSPVYLLAKERFNKTLRKREAIGWPVPRAWGVFSEVNCPGALALHGIGVSLKPFI